MHIAMKRFMDIAACDRFSKVFRRSQGTSSFNNNAEICPFAVANVPTHACLAAFMHEQTEA